MNKTLASKKNNLLLNDQKELQVSYPRIIPPKETPNASTGASG